jgi:hypothetical protein
LQCNEVEKSSVSEISVLGNNVQAIRDVELHKPVKVVLQKDVRGATRRWIEITVAEQTISDAADRKAPPPTVINEKDTRFPDGRSHDFGRVKPDAKLKHTFRIVNTSDAPLGLNSVRVSAACAAGKVNKKVLKPGEKANLEVTVDARRFTGAKTMWVFVDMDDHRNDIGTVIFTLTAHSPNNHEE